MGFDRKHCKERARKNLKEHYFLFIIACMLAAFTGAGYTTSLSGIEATKIVTGDSVIKVNENSSNVMGRLTVDSVLSDLFEGNATSAKEKANESISEKESNELKIGDVSLGYGKGVLSGLINNITSGTVFVTIFQTILSVTKSESIARDIFIVLAALVYLGIMIFIKDTFIVAFKRIFLESYRYEKVKPNRFLFLFRVNKALKSCLTIFICNVYLFLWDLTIVGGVIKYYSYYLVPYIIAENPDISAKDAINLSRDLMNGHKIEAFKIELSFIGWHILSACTLGLLSIFYVNPYMECVKTEYYVYLRSKGKKANVRNSELLNDHYLFYKAEPDLIINTYRDVYEIMNDDIVLEDYRYDGIKGFFANNLGVIGEYDEEEDRYNTAIEQEVKIQDFKYIMALKAYPGRLFPIAEEKKNKRLEYSHYMRHYSIWSLIALFFIFAFIGWSWEVLLHLVNDGVFVNRGTMHGPWLPIYGFGGFFIIQILYRLRSNPGKHMLASIVLCGILEYFTSYFLELAKDTKWWDYSGYFLNINGRICAEGLLVFALGGTAIVYGLAPLIDNQLRKMNQKALKTVLIILLACILVDLGYSIKYPNVGKGITDYGEDKVEVIPYNPEI